MIVLLEEQTLRPDPSPPGAPAERRRTDRVSLTPGIPTIVSGLGLFSTSIIELSLGGATLFSTRRPELHEPRTMLLTFEGRTVETTVAPYANLLTELYYAPDGGSHVRYRIRVVFVEPSIDVLNLLYRIVAANWVNPGNDDTNPLDD